MSGIEVRSGGTSACQRSSNAPSFCRVGALKTRHVDEEERGVVAQFNRQASSSSAVFVDKGQVRPTDHHQLNSVEFKASLLTYCDMLLLSQHVAVRYFNYSIVRLCPSCISAFQDRQADPTPSLARGTADSEEPFLAPAEAGIACKASRF